MKEKIITAITERNGKITFKELKKKLEVDEIELQNLLLELKLDGKILQISNKYSLFPEDLLIGSITKSLSGNIYLMYDSLRIHISSNFFTAVIPNDIVAFKINDKDEAEIHSIIDRPTSNITCEVSCEAGKKTIIPYHSGINVSLSNEESKELLDGDIILVNIDINDQDDYCTGHLIKTIGHKDDPNIKEIAVAINYGFDNDYDEEYLEELKKIPKDTSNEDLSKRIDLRNDDFVTIDGVNTKDMDDAVFARRLDNGNIEVKVSIADVSHYIHPNSKIFKRASEKTTSLYLKNSVFHMFHHLISNGICSLNPDVDRLTKTVTMEVDKQGKIANTKIEKTIIKSRKKMNYNDVDKVLLGEIPNGYENYIELIKLLNEASTKIGSRLENDGFISFANEEPEISYNRDGEITDFKEIDEQSPARKLIEYLMIAANEEVAIYLLYSGLPGVFRIHESPDIRKINEAIKSVNTLGKKIKYVKEVDDPMVIQRIINSLKKDNNYKVISNLFLRFMKRARYSTDNIGHYALSLSSYTHFTSPIRRLADLLVHYILDILLIHPELCEHIDIDDMKEKLQKHCDKASFMERQAQHAEQDQETEAIISRMSKHIGEEYTATVLEVGKKFRVRLNSVDIYIDPKDLSSSFRYNKKKKLYYDYSNDLYLKFGTKVTIRITHVNIANRCVSAEILNIIEPKKLTKKKK